MRNVVLFFVVSLLFVGCGNVRGSNPEGKTFEVESHAVTTVVAVNTLHVLNTTTNPLFGFTILTVRHADGNVGEVLAPAEDRYQPGDMVSIYNLPLRDPITSKSAPVTLAAKINK